MLTLNAKNYTIMIWVNYDIHESNLQFSKLYVSDKNCCYFLLVVYDTRSDAIFVIQSKIDILIGNIE